MARRRWDSEYAGAFIADVKDRLANYVQLTRDGRDAFGSDVDYAQLESAKGVTAPPSHAAV